MSAVDFTVYWSEKQLLDGRKRAAKDALAESLRLAKHEYELKIREAKERYKFTKKSAKKQFKDRVRPTISAAAASS